MRRGFHHGCADGRRNVGLTACVDKKPSEAEETGAPQSPLFFKKSTWISLSPIDNDTIAVNLMDFNIET